MTEAMLEMRIRTLELQLAVLKAQLRRRDPERPRIRFADLCGIWEGLDISEEEIKAAEYRVPWEGQYEE